MTFQKANNKGVDQFAQMRRLLFAFVVRTPLREVFLCQGPYVQWTTASVLYQTR